MGAAGQCGAQVLSDEIPLLCGCEGNGGGLGGREEPCQRLILRCHCPESHVVFGVFIQEPVEEVGGTESAVLPPPPHSPVLLLSLPAWF